MGNCNDGGCRVLCCLKPPLCCACVSGTDYKASQVYRDEVAYLKQLVKQTRKDPSKFRFVKIYETDTMKARIRSVETDYMLFLYEAQMSCCKSCGTR